MFSPHLDRWSLISDGEPIITHSSRLLPVRWQGRPAMLKVAADIDERYGALLMQWWDGDGAAYVYAHEGDAVLLERATGKRSLLAMAMNGEDDEASRILCRTAARLHAPREKPLPDPIPLTRWFRDLEPAAGKHGGTLTDCSAIANTLLADQREVTILHGERGFDFANIFANEELPTITDPARFRRQLAIVSAEAKLEPKRLLQWIAAYSGLSAAWFLGDPNIQQAETALTVARIALAELES
ncbi:aminoglycoside phosphotransferase family protein [Rhizobium leguminosarum]